MSGTASLWRRQRRTRPYPRRGAIEKGSFPEVRLEAAPQTRCAVIERRYQRAIWAFLLLGIAIRLARYALRFPLWGDEYLLTSNFLDRGFWTLLRPLDRHQVAPVAFLWIELGITRLAGFSEWSLRLFPLICGVAALGLFRQVALRLFDARAALMSLAIFAVSSYVIRYNAEAKPYAVDAFASLLLLWLAVGWWQSGRTVWLWSLAGLGPLAVFLSYPSIFVIGALSIALAASVWRARSRWAWLAYLAFNGLMVLGFLAVLRLAAGPQFEAERAVMHTEWSSAFPPRNGLGRLAWWLLETHTGEMFAYPVGAENGGGAVQFLLFAVGVVCMLRGRHRAVAATALAMFCLALAAAAAGRYPYGGHPRLMQYAAPLICLLMGRGITGSIDSMGHASLRKLAVVLAPALFAIFGVATVARDVQHPYRDEHERIYRDAARWFWSEQNKQPGQLVAIDTDLGLDFFPGDSAEMGWLAYRVNQRIYSNWHHRGAAWIDQGRVRTERPLRCVMHHQAGIARDEARYHQWLAEMKTRFDLKSEKVYRWGEVVPRAAEVYEVLEFVPKDPTPNRGRRERGFSLFKGRSAMHSMASDTINGQSPSRL